MKLRTVILVALAMIVDVPSHMVAQTSVSYTTSYDFSGLSISTRTVNGTRYSMLNYTGHYHHGTPGVPSLPVDYIRFSVPYNACNFSVTATPANTTNTAIDYPVWPFQQYAHGGTFTQPDPDAYEGAYPDNVAWFVNDGYLAGENHIVTVAVAPITYTPDGLLNGGVLHKHGAISLQLNYTIDPDKNDVLVRNDTTLRKKAYEHVKEIVVNPLDVESFAFHGTSTYMCSNEKSYYERDTLGIAYPYLIVTTPELKHSLRRIAALKRQLGSNVKIVTVSEMLNSPYAQPGDSLPDSRSVIATDDPGKLRQYLRYHYLHKGTENVLLAGSDVPNRSGNDMYFAALESDWMQLLYDNYAELNVGRLLGERPSSFDNYTDKLLRYELNPGKGDRTYLRRGFCSEDSAHNISNVYTMEHFLPEMTLIEERPDLNYPAGCDLIDSVNVNHYGFWGSYNYGKPSYLLASSDDQLGYHYLWATDTAKVAPGNINDYEVGNGLNRLLNKDYPMVFFSFSGNTMPYETIQGYDVDMNVGESFTMGKDYGGPAYIGMTDFSGEDDTMMFVGDLLSYITSNSLSLGKAFYRAKECIQPNSDNEELLKYLNYLGEPTLDMWTDTPQQFTAPTVTRYNNSITVSGVPTPATVTYFSNDTIAGCVSAATSTLTLNNVSPNSTIMVNKRGYLPFIAPLLIQNATISDSQYIIASSFTAGRSVDSNRTAGEVVINNGIDYEIEASGEVRLEGGFKVEKGAYFMVKPSSF